MIDVIKNNKLMIIYLILLIVICFIFCNPTISQYRQKVGVDTINLEIIEYQEPILPEP